MIDACIAGLLRYAEDTGLIEADDRLWARNRLLEALQLDGCDPDCAPAELPLADLLRELTEDAVFLRDGVRVSIRLPERCLADRTGAAADRLHYRPEPPEHLAGAPCGVPSGYVRFRHSD